MEFLKRAVTALKNLPRSLSPNCREVSRLQSESLDRPLAPAHRLGLCLHLLLCSWCRRYGKQIRFLRQAVRERPDALSDATPGTLSPEAQERLKESLRDEVK